jgi:hypothetical protein
LIRVVKILYPEDENTTYAVGDVGCIEGPQYALKDFCYVKFLRREANGASGGTYVFRQELRLVRKVKDEIAVQEG